MQISSDLGIQLVGLALLIGGVGLGYWRWIWPRTGPMHPADAPARLAQVLILLTLVGGAVGSVGWFFDDPRAFSWNLPPLAGRMLAAAGWAFALISWQVLAHFTLIRARLLMVLLAVYLAPLVIAILLAHLDRFDFGAPVTYAFFIIAGGMAVAACALGWRLSQMPVEPTTHEGVAPPSSRALLQVTAIIASLWGLALFITDQGPSALIWAWRGDLLTSRLIGVMLLTVAVGGVWALRNARRNTGTTRLMLMMVACYGLGLALAGGWNGLSGLPVPWAYVLVFGGLGLLALLQLILHRPILPSSSSPTTAN